MADTAAHTGPTATHRATGPTATRLGHVSEHIDFKARLCKPSHSRFGMRLQSQNVAQLHMSRSSQHTMCERVAGPCATTEEAACHNFAKAIFTFSVSLQVYRTTSMEYHAGSALLGRPNITTDGPSMQSSRRLPKEGCQKSPPPPFDGLSVGSPLDDPFRLAMCRRRRPWPGRRGPMGSQSSAPPRRSMKLWPIFVQIRRRSATFGGSMSAHTGGMRAMIARLSGPRPSNG